MRLWDSTKNVFSADITRNDEYVICEQFFRKINCIKNNKYYKPDVSKDCVLSKFYKFEPFDFHEFFNREHCVETLRCSRFRIQAFEFLEYFKKETLVIELLVKKYHEETDEKAKISLKELAKIKAGNLKLIEHIREAIAEILYQTEDTGDYLETMCKMIKQDK